MTEYIHRYIIIVDWNKIHVANKQADGQQGGYDPDTGGANTFGGVRLSANGLEPPTHTACNTAATDGMRTGIFNAAGNVPFVEIYDTGDGWDYASALADIGLQVIESEEVS